MKISSRRFAQRTAVAIVCVLFLNGTSTAESPGESSGAPGPPCPCSEIKSTTPTKITFPNEGGRSEIWCKNGKKHGTTTSWNNNGAKIFEAKYVEGQRHGMMRRWTPGGKLIEESVYRKDICRLSKRWQPSGRWTYYGVWDDDGQIVYQVSWDADGKKEYEVGLPPANMPGDVPKSADDSISAAIIRRADDYIISKVGAEYFKDKYQFVRSKSEFHAVKTNAHIGEYFLYYRYKPLAHIGSNELLFVRMFDGEYTPVDYVASVVDGRVIEPVISKEQATRIAASEFTVQPGDKDTVTLVVPSWMYHDLKNWTWIVYIDRTSTTDKEVGTITRVFVDAVTGKVVSKYTKGWAR